MRFQNIYLTLFASITAPVNGSFPGSMLTLHKMALLCTAARPSWSPGPLQNSNNVSYCFCFKPREIREPSGVRSSTATPTASPGVNNSTYPMLTVHSCALHTTPCRGEAVAQTTLGSKAVSTRHYPPLPSEVSQYSIFLLLSYPFRQEHSSLYRGLLRHPFPF